MHIFEYFFDMCNHKETYQEIIIINNFITLTVCAKEKYDNFFGKIDN